MENTSSRVSKSLPFVGMIVLNFSMIGSSTLIKAAMTSGLSQYVYVVYYDALGTFILLPFFVHHCLTRKRLPITFSLLCRFFLLSLTGRCLFQIYWSQLHFCYSNICPWQSDPNFHICYSSLFETVGTFVSVLGAIVVTLYKGPSLIECSDSSSSTRKMFYEQSKWLLGCLLFTLGFLLRSVWNIFQADTAKLYPDEFSFVILWFCHSISVATNTVITWCLRKKGALFVSMFDPLSVAIAAFMGFAFLGDGIYLGSVVGSAIIAVGFYAVMWGQAKTTSAMANKIGGLETGSTEFSHNGLTTIGKTAFQSGLNQFVFIVYYDALGTLFLFPWLLCRWIGGKRLPISSSLLCRLFFLSLIGKCLFPICTFTGLKYSSVSVAAAITNLIPVFTFILAVTSRMEKLDLRKFNDQIRTFGAILAVIGALVVSLYKGPTLLKPQGSSSSSSNSAQLLLTEQSNWLIGCLIYTVGILFRSSWNILQADTVKSYPDEVAIVFFYTFFGTIEVAAASFFFVESQSEWQLHSKIEVIAIFYAGFAVSIFNSTAITWCLHIKGPIYVSMFSPLGVGIAAFFGFVFLHDGSVAIIVGFYAVMWGQANTKTAIVKDISGLESLANQETPLLLSSES
ncbi:hypothetical protein V2J09_013611 [Rumex salicifolius]